MSTTAKEASELSYEELKALLEGKKQERIAILRAEIASLEAKQTELWELTGEAPAVRPGRKPNSFNSTAKAAKTKETTGKRDSGMKDKILSFLESKGKDGAHVDDIAKHVSKPKTSVNAFLATTGKKNGVKGKGKRSGIYFLVK